MSRRRPHSPLRHFSPLHCEALEARRLLNAGDLDTSFNGGTTSLILSQGALNAEDAALQSDGKLIVVGTQSGVAKVFVARYNANGSVDLSFGPSGTGYVSIDNTGFGATTAIDPAAVAIQTDDKIVIVATLTQGYAQSVAILRLTPNGAYDPEFSSDGRDILADFDDYGYDDFARDVAIQADGKIVLVAWTDPYDISTGNDFGMARYNTNGTLDSSFAGNGRRRIDLGENENVSSLTIDYSGAPGSANYGKIILVGNQNPSSNTNSKKFVLMRLHPSGTLDSGFSGDGILVVPFGGAYTYSAAREVVVQSTGKIVIAGEVGGDSFATHNIGLMRLNSNGSGDPTFGVGNGQIEIDLGGSEGAQSLLIGQTGNLLVGGSSGGKMAIVGLTSEGVIDGVFSGDGRLVINTPAQSSARELLTAPGGTIIAAGGTNFAAARFFDRKGQTVSIGTFNVNTYEQGEVGTSFLVTRVEALPTPLRVFVGTSGATPPNSFPIRPRDYNGTNISFGNGVMTSTYVDILAGETWANVIIKPVDDTTVEGDEIAIFAISGTANYDVAFNSSTTLIIRDNDTVGGPTVSAASFLYQTAPQQVRFSFNQDVTGSIAAGDFQVLGSGGNVPFTFVHDPVSNTSTLTFSGILPDGNYTARAIATGIRNGGNQPMAADYVFPFFFLGGDANRDRKVNTLDFNVYVANYGLTGKNFSQANFSYDAPGKIDSLDFNIFVAQYGKTVPNPGAALGPGASALFADVEDEPESASLLDF